MLLRVPGAVACLRSGGLICRAGSKPTSQSHMDHMRRQVQVQRSASGHARLLPAA